MSKEVTEDILERRRKCMIGQHDQMNKHMNEVYQACDIWSETGEGEYQEIFSRLSK